MYDKISLLTEKDRMFYGYEKCVVIHNPLTVEALNPIPFKKRNNIAIFVGHLTEEKGIYEILRIWSEFKKTDSNEWELWVLGDSAERKHVEHFSEKLGINKTTRFFGRVKDVPKFLGESKVNLMASKFEGFPLCIVESQAHCVPSIAYDCDTGPKELIDNGKSGYVIEGRRRKDFLDKLQYMLSNDDVLMEFSAEALKNSKKFKIDSIYSSWRKEILQS